MKNKVKHLQSRQVRHYQFVSGDGKDVDARIVGDYYPERTLHDWKIVIGNDHHELTETDGYDAFDFLDTHVTFTTPSTRHFQALVIQDVLGNGDMSIDEALDAQEAWWNAVRETFDTQMIWGRMSTQEAWEYALWKNDPTRASRQQRQHAYGKQTMR